MPPPLASLLGLPQELQDSIIQLVATCSENPIQDLIHLSYTCKSLHSTCLPHIYSIIILYSRYSCYQHAALLARTLSTSPAQPGKYIKHLSLSGLIFAHKLPEAILLSTPRLTSLTCHFAAFQPFDSDGTSVTFDTASLVLALRNVSATLVFLEISLCTPFTSDAPIQFRHYDSLDVRELVALREVCMPISLLLGYTAARAKRFSEVLPRDLRHLSIEQEQSRVQGYTWTSDGVLEKLKGFVGEGKSTLHTPKLEKVSVHDNVWADWRTDVAGMRAPARTLCEKEGLVYVGSRKGIMEDDWSSPEVCFISY